jgi:hypothetical protein
MVRAGSRVASSGAMGRESMTGARFVHDTLERCGWAVEVADAVKVKGWRRWHARPTRSTWVLAELSPRPRAGDLALAWIAAGRWPRPAPSTCAGR